jgi:prevent-host-death family protein
MKVMHAREAKNLFGQLLDFAQKEPVLVTKKGRAVAMVLSIDEYERLEDLENQFWAKKAEEAEGGGFIGEKESDKLLTSLLNAKD